MSFSWQLPTLLSESARSLPLRDNPGSAYLQALAETGAIGFFLTLTLAYTFLVAARFLVTPEKEAA